MDGLDELLALTISAFYGHLDATQRWRRDAACREHPEIDFFPVRGVLPTAARQVCAECLVRCECADYAVGVGPQLTGVWGGMTGKERRSVRRFIAHEVA